MLGSIEFYVVAAFVAAAVIGIVAMPKSRGEVRTFLYAGELDSSACDTEPSVVAHVDNHGRLEIYRYGLEGVGMAGAFSLAVKINGFDVTIEERLTTGNMSAGKPPWDMHVSIVSGLNATTYSTAAKPRDAMQPFRSI